MTLRIETANDENGPPTVRLIGRIRAEHLNAIRTELDRSSKRSSIDLAEVTNLDVEAVRFLSARELEGFRLLNCVPFIREWIQRERETEESQ